MVYGAFARAAVVLAAVSIHDIQGAGHVSPVAGQAVADIRGVVTASAPNGFYMQDEEPDRDDATSEGLRVVWHEKIGSGDLITVAGRVSEEKRVCASCSDDDALRITQLIASDVVVVEHGHRLPEPIWIGGRAGHRAPPAQAVAGVSGLAPASVDVETPGYPFDPRRNAIDFFESLEGMRVGLKDALVVGPTVHASNSATVVVVADAGEGVLARTLRGGLLETEANQHPERIMVTGAAGIGIPELDVGDSLRGPLSGIVDQAVDGFELVATEPLSPAAPGLGAAEARAVGVQQIAVATFNLENFGPSSSPAKTDRTAEVIVHELDAPDLLVLEEVQDESGPRDDGVTDAAKTYKTLAAAVAARGGPRYEYRDVPPCDDEDGGEPGANIRVGFFFRTDRGLSFVDRPGATCRSNDAAIRASGSLELTHSPARLAADDPVFFGCRKLVAAELTIRGVPVFVVGVHLTSQLADAPMFARFQPPLRPSREVRRSQAETIARFARSLLDASPDALLLILGDFNDGAESPAVAAMSQAGLQDLMERVPSSSRYTYVFQGNADLIDHIFASPLLAARMARVEAVHVDADFANHASDHDPVVAWFEWREDSPQPATGCIFAPARPGASWLLLLAPVLSLHRRTKRRPIRARRSY